MELTYADENNLDYRLDIYHNMIYNFSRYRSRLAIFTLAMLILLGALTVGGTENIGAVAQLTLRAALSDDGRYIEVSVGSPQAVCGVLATLFYDSERLAFMTFAKSDGLGESADLSCTDADGEVRFLIDGEENFENDSWCRFFFEIKENSDCADRTEACRFEFSLAVSSAYFLSDDRYREIVFADGEVLPECGEDERQETSEEEPKTTAEADWTDFGLMLEGYCAVSFSCFAEQGCFAAGFEVSVSCENVTEIYTVTRALPVDTDKRQKYSVVIFLPMRESFYVEVRAIGYTPRGRIDKEDKSSFFISRSGIGPIGTSE